MKYPTLTDKQEEFFNAIVHFTLNNDRWPTHRELMDEFGFKSPRSVNQRYQALVKKHYLVKKDWGVYDIHPVQKYRIEDEVSDEREGIPIIGIITAGGLQEAVEADLGRVTLQSILPNYNNIRALVVSGRSMKDCGIEDGDIILYIKDEIYDGDIGAIRYRGDTTLKRIYRTSSGVKLLPANDDHDPIIIRPEEFEEINIIGKYIGHINEKGLHKV